MRGPLGTDLALSRERHDGPLKWRRVSGPLLALLSVVVTLGGLEGVLRSRLDAHAREALPYVGLGVEDQNRVQWSLGHHGVSAGRSLLAPDAFLGWRPRPRMRLRSREVGKFDVVVTTNRDGLRGKQRVSKEKRPGVTRIGVFGCSQTFGTGVADEQTYSARLGATLPGVEVLNFGVAGYGTDQMMLYYESEGVRRGLDVVVLGFAYYHLERNLLAFRSYAKPRFELSPDGTLSLTGVPVPGPEAFAGGAGIAARHALLDRSMLLRSLWQRILTNGTERLYRPDSAAWRLTRALIARLAADARAAGARFVLLNLEDGSPGLEPELARLAGELDVGFVNAGPSLRAERQAHRRLRLPNDPHWNPAGHRLIAATLCTYLCTPLDPGRPSDDPCARCAADAP
jgi:hypothetical protein